MAIDLIKHNPLLKKPLLAILGQCQSEQAGDRASLEQEALASWDDDWRQSPSACVDILVRNGALEEQVYVDGQPYAGTLEDLQLDADVPDDATAEARVSITQAGQELLDAYAPEATLRALLDEKPAYYDVFAAALEACAAKGGCTRDELEAVINQMPQLKPDPETKRTSVYPQYFIDALETAGGISWQGAWHITEVGKAAL